MNNSELALNTVSHICLLLLLLLNIPITYADELQKKCEDISSQRSKYMEVQSDGGIVYHLEPVEKLFLNLLDEYSSESDKGRIYFTLTDLYCQCGLTDPDSAIKYAKKALEFPLDGLDKIRAYIAIGDALQVKNIYVIETDRERIRKEIVLPYLEGINFAVDEKIPMESVPVPHGGHRFCVSTSSDDEETKKRVAKLYADNAAQMAAWKKAQYINSMVEHRDVCINQTVFLYSKKPYATDELKGLAGGIIKDETVVEKIIKKVNEKIKENENCTPSPN